MTEEQFNELYAKYHKQLFAHILKKEFNVQDAEEIAQDVWITLWNKQVVPDNPFAYLKTVAKMKIGNVIKKKRAQKRAFTIVEYIDDINYFD